MRYIYRRNNIEKEDLIMTLFDYLKNILLILIIIQFIPFFIKNIQKTYSNYIEQKSSIGVIHISGILYDSAPLIKELESLFKNNEIKGILIKMECSGSAAGTGQIIFNEIQEFKEEYPKPIIVLVENMCASGGYWIACGCDSIIAPATALIGSIGVCFPYLFQLKEGMEQYKIHYISMKAGAYKTATDPFTDITPEQTAMLQSVLDDTYAQFTQSVAQSRKLSVSTISSWAEGKIFTGAQAKQLGLIDEIGSLQSAIRFFKNKALIEGEIQWVCADKDEGLFGFLSKQDFCASIIRSITSACMGQLHIMRT
jgi:protease IV